MTFVDGPTELVASWSEPAPHPLMPELRHLIRRIEKLITNQLTGLDLVMSWFTRRIQPLQHHAHLLHQYTEDQEDDLRVTKDSLPGDTLEFRLKKITKLKAKQKLFGLNICLDTLIFNIKSVSMLDPIPPVQQKKSGIPGKLKHTRYYKLCLLS
jgi:hypothetical protein